MCMSMHTHSSDSLIGEVKQYFAVLRHSPPALDVHLFFRQNQHRLNIIYEQTLKLKENNHRIEDLDVRLVEINNRGNRMDPRCLACPFGQSTSKINDSLIDEIL